MTRNVSFAFILVLVLSLSPIAAIAQHQSPVGMAFLDLLAGEWNMPGTIHGDSTHFYYEAHRALHDKLLLMNMRDLAVPSAYEASVYIGFDSARSSYVTFWLDNFGVDSNMTVLGYGKQRGDTLVILFKFPGAPFRDTFSYDPSNETWHFLLEDGDLQGNWKTFADYRLSRKKR